MLGSGRPNLLSTLKGLHQIPFLNLHVRQRQHTLHTTNSLGLLWSLSSRNPPDMMPKRRPSAMRAHVRQKHNTFCTSTFVPQQRSYRPQKICPFISVLWTTAFLQCSFCATLKYFSSQYPLSIYRGPFLLFFPFFTFLFTSDCRCHSLL